jgi:hypothetical protein
VGKEKARSIKRLAIEREIKDAEKWSETDWFRTYVYPFRHQGDVEEIRRTCPDLESLVIVGHRIEERGW